MSLMIISNANIKKDYEIFGEEKNKKNKNKIEMLKYI